MAGSTVLDARQGQPKIHADLQDVAQRVHQEFDERLDPKAVDECLNRVAGKFDNAKIRFFVPLLVRRHVRGELHERLGAA